MSADAGSSSPRVSTDDRSGSPEPGSGPGPGETASAEGASGRRTAHASHFDETDKVGDAADATAHRRSATTEGIAMFGGRTSGVTLIGERLEINAPIVGGDLASGGGAGVHLAYDMVPTDVVTDARDTFIAPQGWERVDKPFRDGRRVLLLGTRPRWGNTTVGVRLLDGMGTLRQLRYDGSLGALPVESLPPDSGYLFDAATRPALVGLRLHELETLEARLAGIRSRLVVIADAGRAAEHVGRSIWSELTGPPPAYDVLIGHLRGRVGSERAVALVDDAGLDDELAAITSDTFDVRQLVELARDLGDADRGGGTLEQAVGRFRNWTAQAVEQWLDDEIVDGGDLALVLALSVLDGMPYDAVSRWATDLERRWPADTADGFAASRTRRRSRRARLIGARARVRTETRQTRYGPAPLEIASFVDDSYPQRILSHYWNEHDYDREILLDWLRAMGSDVEVRVATRAAVAVGYIGTFAFDIVRREVVMPWAGSGAGDERELAVAALALPARCPDTVGRTVRLVGDWSRRSATATRMTAARALGYSVGAVLDGGPDHALERLADGADGRLATALGDSVAELMVEADPARQIVLLDMFDRWSTEGRSGRQLAGVLGFLEAAWTLWITVEGRRWPTLLWLAETGDRSGARGPREPIRALWGRALVAPGADNGVRTVLGTWADAAQRDLVLRPALVRLLTDSARTPRQANLLTRHAHRWRDRRPAAPDIARTMLDALSGGSRRHV